MIRNLFICVVVLLPVGHTFGQQATFSTPVTTTSDRFFESFNVNWGFQTSSPSGGMFFRFGSPNGAVPPFGGFTPQSASRLSFGIRGGGASSFFDFSAAQGSQRTIQSTVPSLTVMNGEVGSIQSGTIRPFVTGFVPVVGARATSPLVERLERLKYEQARPIQGGIQPEPTVRRVYPSRGAPARSTAETTDVSVAEILEWLRHPAAGKVNAASCRKESERGILPQGK